MYINTFALVLGLASFAPAEAFFRMPCPGILVRDRLDPIVNPGGVASHVHTINGGSAFSANMTYEDARAAKCSSCKIKEDMSNYWTPQLYVKKKSTGKYEVVKNGGLLVYYLQRGEKEEKLKAFPEGFRMLAGDPNLRSFTGEKEAKAINYACLDYNGGGKPETNELPNYNCPNGLRAQVFFPSCWDGKNVDSEDHKSHVSYPDGQNYNNGACPSSHPVHLISIFFEVTYDVDDYKEDWDGDKHPFVFSQGDPTGFGLHGDFINGWDVDVLQKAVDTCTADSGVVEECGAVTLFTNEESKACRIDPVVDEEIEGPLDKLPGCNEITSGPENAKTATECGDEVQMGKKSSSAVDVPGWEYVGCGKDDISNRAFTGDREASDDMTVERCLEFCSGGGFSYAALEYGRECYCNKDLPESAKPKEGFMGDCTKPCAGNEKQMCGNGGAMNIYQKCEGDACKSTGTGEGEGTEKPSAGVAQAKSTRQATTLQTSMTKAAAPSADAESDSGPY